MKVAPQGSLTLTPRGRSGTIRIHLSTADVRDVSDKQFPAEIVRCAQMPNGEITVTPKRTVTEPSTLQAGIDFAAAGWCPGAVKQWVEIRTHASRLPKGEK